MRIILITFLFYFISIKASNAQELNCFVEINAEQIPGTETRVFETLEAAVYAFMNNRRWTTETFQTNERIECAIQIVLSEKTSTKTYKASIQVQSKRTVYNSGYSSPMFNHKDDDFNFTYTEYDPLEFNMTSHLSNLTSVLAFYAYMIIGLDYDSFELNGGSKYLDMAQKIVANAQSASEAGWKAFESDKNRFSLAQAINDQFNAPMRSCNYNYHMKGLDVMWTDVEGGRKVITDALNGLEKIHQARPSSFLMKVFFNAKADEIINIYSQSQPAEARQISTLCKTLDPGNSSKYSKLPGGG